MNQQSNQKPNNQSIVIEDLAAKNAEEIKGGPTPIMKRDVILKTSVTENSGLEDLEPIADVQGGALKGKPQHLVNLGF